MPSKDKPKDLTPEERLFKLIQEGEKTEESDDTLIVSSDVALPKPQGLTQETGASVEGLSATPQGTSGAVLEAGMREKKAVRASAFRSGALAVSPPSLFQNYFSLKVLNRVLFICLAVAAFYFVMAHGVFRKSANQDFLRQTGAAEPTQAPLELPEELFKVNVSRSLIPGRNVFQPYQPPKVEPVSPPAPTETPPAQVEDLGPRLANLKLTGLYMGEIPEALIEAEDEKRTYPIKVGSEFRGLTVKGIQADGVLFTDGHAEQLLK